MSDSSLIFDAHQRDLDRLARENRLRRLIPRLGLDFSSNDYLGLANSSELSAAVRAALDRGVPVGSGGSRLLRGNHEEHERLEQAAAQFFGSESALYFSNGFAANSALLATLPQRGDLVIADELIHASAHEGLRISRSEHLFARHNDAAHFAEIANAWRAKGGGGRIWLAAESLYSMDGDRAPLDDLYAIARRHDGVLLIDEAHAVGVFGSDGRGLGEHLHDRENVVTLVTCGKALGCEGALVCGPARVREFLVNRGRPFIFSTAPSPLMAATTLASLELLQGQPQRRQRLWRNIRLAQDVLESMNFRASGSQILPIIVGNDRTVMDVASGLQDAGFDVRGIRPPTVPQGTSRLRISITLNVTESDIVSLFDMLAEVLATTSEQA